MINLHRQNGRAGGGVRIFIHESRGFKKRKDFIISKNDGELLSIELINITKNITLSSVYRSPNSSLKQLKSSLNPIFDNICRNNNDLNLVGDFNINVLDYENNLKVKNAVNFALQNSLIPLINKPARVTTTNSIAIDLILTNAFLNEQIRTGIIKTEISNHFPLFLITDPTTSSKIKKLKITCLFH